MVINCPHCNKLLGIESHQVEFKTEPLFIGDCRDCLHCEDLPEPFDDFVTGCALQGNVNPIHFTQADLDSEKNPAIAEGHEYPTIDEKWVCTGFKPRA